MMLEPSPPISTHPTVGLLKLLRQSFLITRNAVLAACSRRSLWLPAVELLQDFRRESLQVNTGVDLHDLELLLELLGWEN